MKRRKYNTNNQPFKKLEVLSSKDCLRSKITAKLQSLFDGFVSELQSISKDKKPDVTELFKAGSAVNGFAETENVKSILAENKTQGIDETAAAFQNFIHSAKSRISGLLSKEQEPRGSCENNILENLSTFPQVKTEAPAVDPLQSQISSKLQSLLCKALDNKRLSNNGENQSNSPPGEAISETEWQDLSSMLHDFMSNAKQKISASLSNQPSLSAQQESGTTELSDTARQSYDQKLCPSEKPYRFSNGHSSTLKQKPNLNTKFDVNKPHSQTSKAASTMESPLSSSSFNSSGSGQGGILLLDDAERAPEYLDLGIDTDVDDPSFDNPESDSDEEVVVLGEKRPTYQEITLEEDEDGEVYESVVEKELQKAAENEEEVEELLLHCPICGKTFRVESLLKFHVRMHGGITTTSSPMTSVSNHPTQICNTSLQEEEFIKNQSDSHQSSSAKENENVVQTSSSRSSHKHLAHQEKKKKFSKHKNKKCPL